MNSSGMTQLAFFLAEEEKTATNGWFITKGQELGTFKDSLRAPVHRWFKYPAGYSYKFVEVGFELFGVKPGDWVYDPFSGSGTTILCAKQKGINAYGVEAHSFVHWVADVKLYWEFNLVDLNRQVEYLLTKSRAFAREQIQDIDIAGIFPELIYKCYHPQDLRTLYLLREFIQSQIEDPHIQNLLSLALTDTLRNAADARTGWPYVAPRKDNQEMPLKDAFTIFQKMVRQMYFDLQAVQVTTQNIPPCTIHNILGDSRQRQNLADNQVKLALTSPPYLNNYDYADRTRLETFFWGITQSWQEISRNFRDKLIVAATTQINRSKYQVETAVSSEIKEISPQVYNFLQESVMELAQRRLQKGGKKDYDLMVALYFNDLVPVIKETYRVLEPGGHFCLVLGDSAPYGVHIQTDQIIGQLGLGLGFRDFKYEELRQRGGKWKENPQRHNIPLREGVVILTK
ncbi:MAG: site-specific DNA-methyltransferase [Anaerolineae bacterium]|nr:site-specific DNA-methyltransferase [Anaerolineae bacterium]